MIPSPSDPIKDHTPLELLSEVFQEDMRAVNAIILERMDSPIDLIPKLAGYLIAAGGKRIRPLLTLASTKLYDGDMRRAHKLAAAVEFIHTATLLHDDVVDESKERRGQKTAHLVFGNQASVLVGDFLFSKAFQLMVEDGSLEVLRILSDASAIIAQGEIMQLSFMRNLDTTMEDYLQIIRAKTAALFAAACEIGPVIGQGTLEDAKSMASYGLHLGTAFQIADDTLDYDSHREILGKTIGDDFREGKITAPILFALENASESDVSFWNRTIEKNDQQKEDLKTAQAIFQKHNAAVQALDMAQEYAQKAHDDLESRPSSSIQQYLGDLAFYTVSRKR